MGFGSKMFHLVVNRGPVENVSKLDQGNAHKIYSLMYYSKSNFIQSFKDIAIHTALPLA